MVKQSHCEAITRGSRKIPVKTLFGPFTPKDSNFNVFTIQRAAILILLFKCIMAEISLASFHMTTYQALTAQGWGLFLKFISPHLGDTSFGMQCYYQQNLPTSSVNINSTCQNHGACIFHGSWHFLTLPTLPINLCLILYKEKFCREFLSFKSSLHLFIWSIFLALVVICISIAITLWTKGIQEGLLITCIEFFSLLCVQKSDSFH